MANAPDLLQSLAELGYTAGVGAVGDDELPISYRIEGFGISLAITAGELEETVAALKDSHDDRVEAHEAAAALAARDPEEVAADQEKAAAAVERERQDRLDKFVARIEKLDLPAGAKAILEELAELVHSRPG